MDITHRFFLIWNFTKYFSEFRLISANKLAVKAKLLAESCTKYRSEAPNALFLSQSWSDFDPQAYYLYGEGQNNETRLKTRRFKPR
jgi:hypothetical protein